MKDTDLLPKAKYIVEVKVEGKGYVKSIDAEEIGKAALYLGAGRETIESKLDLAVGIVLNKKVDDKVELGEVLAYIHSNNMEKAERSREKATWNIFDWW